MRHSTDVVHEPVHEPVRHSLPLFTYTMNIVLGSRNIGYHEFVGHEAQTTGVLTTRDTADKTQRLQHGEAVFRKTKVY